VWCEHTRHSLPVVTDCSYNVAFVCQMTPSYIILRLKVEEKKASKMKYSPDTILFIEETVAHFIKIYNIVDKTFEVTVRTKDGIMCSCHIKMSFDIFRYFVRAHGSVDMLERDYEIIEKFA